MLGKGQRGNVSKPLRKLAPAWRVAWLSLPERGSARFRYRTEGLDRQRRFGSGLRRRGLSTVLPSNSVLLYSVSSEICVALQCQPQGRLKEVVRSV